MRPLVVCASLVLFQPEALAQVFDVSDFKDVVLEPEFNEEYIRNHRIKRMKAFVLTQKKGEKPVRSRLFLEYQFDSLGRMIKVSSNLNSLRYTDTVFRKFEYNEKHDIVRRIEGGKTHDLIHQYTYHDDGKLATSKYSQYFHPDSTDSISGTPPKEVELHFERYVYENNGEDLQKVTYNSQGRPYLKSVVKEDSLGVVYFEESYMVSGRNRILKEFEYNDIGRPGSAKITQGSGKTEEVACEYDDHHRLTAMYIKQNGEDRKEIQVVYSSRNGLLDSFITRDQRSGFLHIISFRELDFY